MTLQLVSNVVPLQGSFIEEIAYSLLSQLHAAGDIYGFIELGGPVFLAVVFITFWLWVLILERVFFLGFAFSPMLLEYKRKWNEHLSQMDYASNKWKLNKIRASLISELRLASSTSLKMITTLIALAPLLGLLGTVTGMLEVFDVIAITGSNNARTMAAGIAKATVPTMAGMVTALSGIYFRSLINSWSNRQMIRARNTITFADHAPENKGKRI